jgi:hypothetical protein
MSKYDERAAKALSEAKDDCGHPPHLRSTDRDTGDEFCMDCGRVTREYVNGMGGKFPGNRAIELITEKLKQEFPNQIGRVILHYVEPVAADEFNVLIGLTVPKMGSEWRHYKLIRRDGTDESAEVEQFRSFKEKPKDKEQES